MVREIIDLGKTSVITIWMNESSILLIYTIIGAPVLDIRCQCIIKSIMSNSNS